jgi:hypothetical protein
VFDFAWAVILAVAGGRAVGARSAAAAALAIVPLGWLGVVAALALGVDRGGWGTAGPIGLLFIGPTAILQDRRGLAGLVTDPLLVAFALAAMTAMAAVILARRARDLHPDAFAARALARAELAFVGAACFGGIRAVAALLALALGRDRLDLP